MKKRSFSKRGSIKLSLWTVVELVVLMMILIAFLGFVNSVRNNHFYKKSFMTKDMAYMMDTIQSVPGDVSYVYNNYEWDMAQYSYKFFDDNIEITENGELPRQVDYPYYDNKRLENSYGSLFKSPRKLVFSKRGDGIFLSEDLQTDLIEFVCPLPESGANRIDDGILRTYYMSEESEEIATMFAQGYGYLNAVSLETLKEGQSRNTDVNSLFEDVDSEEGTVVNSGSIGDSLSASIASGTDSDELFNTFVMFGNVFDQDLEQTQVHLYCVDASQNCLSIICNIRNSLYSKNNEEISGVMLFSNRKVDGVDSSYHQIVRDQFNPSLYVMVVNPSIASDKQRMDFDIASAVEEGIKKFDEDVGEMQ